MSPIVQKNKLQTPQCEYSNQLTYAASVLLTKITLMDKNAIKWAILDSGASSHFILSTTPCQNKAKSDHPLTIRLPNGDAVITSHICELDINEPPDASLVVHVLPGLHSHSLVSVVKLCNVG